MRGGIHFAIIWGHNNLRFTVKTTFLLIALLCWAILGETFLL